MSTTLITAVIDSTAPRTRWPVVRNVPESGTYVVIVTTITSREVFSIDRHEVTLKKGDSISLNIFCWLEASLQVHIEANSLNKIQIWPNMKAIRVLLHMLDVLIDCGRPYNI